MVLPSYSEGQQLTWWIFLSVISIIFSAAFLIFIDEDDFNEMINRDKRRPKNLKTYIIFFILFWVVNFIMVILQAPACYYGMQTIKMSFSYELWIYVGYIITSSLMSPIVFLPWSTSPMFIDSIDFKDVLTGLVIFASLGLAIALTVLFWLQSNWAIVFLFTSVWWGIPAMIFVYDIYQKGKTYAQHKSSRRSGGSSSMIEIERGNGGSDFLLNENSDGE